MVYLVAVRSPEVWRVRDILASLCNSPIAHDSETFAATMAAASTSSGYTAATVPICDPHFHFWDTKSTPNSNLGDLDTLLPVYLAKDYLADFAELNLVRLMP